MINLLAAISTTTYIACTNCSGVGSIEITCPDCGGKGLVKVVLTSSKQVHRYNIGDQFIACKKCFKGMASKGAKGSGKVKKTCSVCKGQKKIKPLTTSKEK